MNKQRKLLFIEHSIITIGIFVFILMLIQQSHYGLITGGQGSDISFGFQRIYEIIQQVKHGYYDPYSMHYTFSGVGRIVNGLYPTGPIVWINAFVIGITHSWIFGYIFFQLTVFIIGTLGMYSLTNTIINTKETVISAFLVVFTSLFYGFEAVQVNAFMYSFGMNYSIALFPMIISGLIKTLKNTEKKMPNWELVIGLFLLATNHLLGIVIVVLIILMISISLILLKETSWKILLKKAGITLLIVGIASSFVYIPMLQLMINNDLQQPWNFSMEKYTSSSKYILIALILLGIINCSWFLHIKNKTVAMLGNIGVLLVLLSTKIFPWTNLDDTKLAVIQFPSRFLVFGIGLLVVAILAMALYIGRFQYLILGIWTILLFSVGFKFWETQQFFIQKNSTNSNNLYIKTHNADIAYYKAEDISPKLTYKEFSKAVNSSDLSQLVDPTITYKPLIDYLPVTDNKGYTNNNRKVVNQIDKPKLVYKRNINIHYNKGI